MNALVILVSLIFWAQSARAYDLTRFKKNEAVEPLLCADFEVKERPPENAWLLTEAAFSKVRDLPEGRDRARLAEAYNGSLAPALRRLRHSVFFTLKMTQTLDISIAVIENNAKKGIVSRPRAVDDFRAGEETGPRPVATDDLLKYNAMAEEEAAAARRVLEKALADLEQLKDSGRSPAMREAHAVMTEAARRALDVARAMESLEAREGPLAGVVHETTGYMELVNKKKARDADAYKRLLVMNNETMRAFVRTTSELAENLDQAKLLHVEIDRLGTL